MDAATLQIEILQKSKDIINILGIIQVELEELNAFTKPNGCLDVAVTEGVESLEELAKSNDIPLKNTQINKIMKETLLQYSLMEQLIGEDK